MPNSFLVNIANQLKVLAFWIPFSLFYYAIFFPFYGRHTFIFMFYC